MPAFRTVKLFDLASAPTHLHRIGLAAVGLPTIDPDDAVIWEMKVRSCTRRDETESGFPADHTFDVAELEQWLRQNGAEEGETVLVKAEQFPDEPD